MSLLLSSVFKPFAVDDDFGRKENVMELFHNQVTREQGIFSLRMNHPSAGLHLIAENLETPTMVLDFPSLAEFEREVARGYETVGLSFIVPNFKKAQHMARRVRELAPASRIVLGGHGTSIPEVERLIPCDAVCRGDGVGFMRRLFGEDEGAPVRHPVVDSAFNRHFLGAPLTGASAFLMPGNGCPNACDFCCTSHFFKRQYVPYLRTGREVFDACLRIERESGAREFFVLDENFLKYRERTLELVELMQRHDKQWSFGLFSSAESINQYGLELLQRLGIFFLWIGVESKRHVYAKNAGVDLKGLIARLRSQGTCVLASGILFLEHHTLENIEEDIDFMVGLEADFVQFMQLGPLPGTALYERIERQGRLRRDIPFEEWHGQHRLWFDHPAFTLEESERWLREAFRRDLFVNGPSMLRMVETYLAGYEGLEGVSDRFLVGRRALLRSRLEDHRPSLPVLARMSPSAGARRRALGLERRLEALLGPRDAVTLAKTAAVSATALKESLRLATVGSVRQPPTRWTPYRIEPVALATRVRSFAELNLVQKPALWARGAAASGFGVFGALLRGVSTS